jgi:hypothetical protein
MHVENLECTNTFLNLIVSANFASQCQPNYPNSHIIVRIYLFTFLFVVYFIMYYYELQSS